MPTTITGDRDNVTTPLTRTVSTTSGNGVSPISVTTTVPHLFGDGDVVNISGVLGNTNANGWQKITVTGANTFTLNGTTGNGAYGGGPGSVTDYSLTPQFQVPSDADPPTAASVNAAFQALADRAQFCNSPPSSTINGTDSFTSSIIVPPYNPQNGGMQALLNDAVWCHKRIGPQFLVDLGTASAPDSTLALLATFASPNATSGTLLTSTNQVVAGDTIEGVFGSTVDVEPVASATSCVAQVLLQVSENAGASWADIPNAFQYAMIEPNAGFGQEIRVPVTVPFSYTVVAAGPLHYQLRTKLVLNAGTAGDQASMSWAYTLVARAWRAS